MFGYSDLVGQKHLPWCAVDSRDKLVYSSEFDPTHINVYRFRDKDLAELVARIELGRVLCKVQGGCIYENRLYVSCDDDKKGIYEVDLSSGDVSTLLETRIPYEMEGLCISDKLVLHFIDHDGQFYHAKRV